MSVLDAVIALGLAAVLAVGAVADYVPTIKNAKPEPEFDRLPAFYTSDADYDAFVNDYFMHHLSVDERGVYWKSAVAPGIVDHMWEKDWDAWFLPWIDRGAMGLARQHGNTSDIVLHTLLRSPVDKYGYVYGSLLYPEGNNQLGGYRPTFGWPWPKYIWNRTVTRPTGWEFNETGDAVKTALAEWTAKDAAIDPAFADFRMTCKITGPSPEITTPRFDVDVFQVPIIELDVEYIDADGKRADKLIKDLRVYWTSDKDPEFSEDASVGVGFASLPPGEFVADYAVPMSDKSARYPLYFPMYMHPKWGREGRRITQVKIALAGPSAEGTSVAVNYIRATYDVRMSVSNTILIFTAYRFYTWSGDDEFLRAIMPRLRRAALFLNEHLKGREDALLNFAWMVGHDGLVPQVGHGLIGSYWDLLPAGHYDLESSLGYYAALRGMAELEDAAQRLGIDVAEVSVLGPDNKTKITYHETPASLRALARRVKRKIETRFWNAVTGRFARNIDVLGNKHDYGFLHFNLLALAHGIGTQSQRRLILSWLDGRVIPGDTSTGADIYHWRFAPRTSTKRNTAFYFWPWVEGMRADPTGYHVQWGNQIQDGGAVPMTSFLELLVRTRTFDQKQIDRAFERTLEIKQWFEDVKSADGKSMEFYRAYYKDHPERGCQQGGGPPGGLGLDREFLSDASTGTAFIPYAFLGINTTQDRVLDVAPALPSRLSEVGVRNVYYRGNHLTIEAGRNYVSFEGSRIPNGKGLKARVTLHNVPKTFRVLVDGRPWTRYSKTTDGGVSVLIDLKPVRVEVR